MAAPTRPRARRAPRRTVAPSPAALKRRVTRLTKAREAEARRHARQLAALQRRADRQLAAMVGEIASLRHHEARAEALSRLLAEQQRRIARLEALLEKPTPASIG